MSKKLRIRNIFSNYVFELQKLEGRVADLRLPHHASRITHHASRITHHASHITHHGLK